ncbi:MAG: LPP20 family lipoprotein [Campylobacterota bacterium]|nr:LPP20 family lipoprotein [Campylobacterota bacterium]
MKYSLLIAVLIVALLQASKVMNESSTPTEVIVPTEVTVQAISSDPYMVDVACEEEVLKENKKLHISVVGQGVAPMHTSSPAQAYALAKRAAVADAYRLIAEKVKGVRIDGQDLIKNMMVKRSTVRTSVAAMVRNSNIVETTYKEGLCEVEMEIVISHAQFQ